MTAVLSWHVQKFVVIRCCEILIQQNRFKLNWNYVGKIVSEMGPVLFGQGEWELCAETHFTHDFSYKIQIQ